MFCEDEIIPISALQHWLYCPRQCALVHLEQAWAENKFTAEGRVMHENAHAGADQTKAGVRITRGMPVASADLGLTGHCDVVEFHPVGGDLRFEVSDLRGSAATCAGRDSVPEISDLEGSNAASSHVLSAGIFESQILSLKLAARVVPVEYKRGKPKAHRADEVQLCAQAMCLEEMLGIRIEIGALYYGENRRRTEVPFEEVLRELVRNTTAEVRACFTSGRTPLAEYEPRRCDNCSLIDQCQPLAMRYKNGAAAWFSANLKSELSSPKSP